MKSWITKSLALAVVMAAGIAVATQQPAAADKQPRMRQALMQLEKVKDTLQNAESDKGGHRVKALQLVNEAIDEVKKGMEFDNKH